MIIGMRKPRGLCRSAGRRSRLAPGRLGASQLRGSLPSALGSLRSVLSTSTARCLTLSPPQLDSFTSSNASVSGDRNLPICGFHRHRWIWSQHCLHRIATATRPFTSATAKTFLVGWFPETSWPAHTGLPKQSSISSSILPRSSYHFHTNDQCVLGSCTPMGPRR